MHDKQTHLTVHMSKRLHKEPADGFEYQKKNKETHEECEEKDRRGKERQHSFSVGPNLGLFHKR